MASIQFRIRSKANKNVSIKIRVSNGRSLSLEQNTGFSINPNEWSESNDLPKQTNNKLLISNLKKLDNYILDNLNKDLANNVLIDKYWLEDKIKSCFDRVETTDKNVLINHIQYIIDNANTRKVKTNGGYKIGLSKNTIKNYNIFKNIILEYQIKIKKQIHFVEITKPFVDRYTNWLINTKNYSTNYAGKQLEMLKTICIDAEKNEIKVSTYSKNIQHFRESDNDRYIQTLSFKELEQIKNYDFTDVKKLEKFKKENPKLTKDILIAPKELINARNWVLLGCEIGQRGGDLLKITEDNVRYKGESIYLDVLQEKTNKDVTIGVIEPFAIDIIKNQFPIKIPHQKLNNYVKIICKLAGIDEVVKGKKLDSKTNRMVLGFYPKYELIASHSFRRSFASNYYKIIPTPILINTTGHSKESMFLKYINRREDKDANADLFMQFYEQINKDKEPTLKVIKNA